MSRVHINELFAQTASKAKKMRYFYSLFSENLRFTQNLPNEVFLTISDFKVDIPYKHTLRITLVLSEFVIFCDLVGLSASEFFMS